MRHEFSSTSMEFQMLVQNDFRKSKKHTDGLEKSKEMLLVFKERRKKAKDDSVAGGMRDEFLSTSRDFQMLVQRSSQSR